MSGVTALDENVVSALEEAISVLRGLAEPAMDDQSTRYMRDLGERRETCAADERDEHRHLAEFWRRRTLLRLRSLNALRRLHAAAPELVGELPQLDDEP